ncbi:N-acetylneuraminate lyase-like [Saccoglossus kowalevskii]|uniref:N-acetylneuraminate lyase n=1 Tax=Saccoglossus kowalevskii TaxID=10224 RepID=A0ABM0M7J9_SACKO|nr:PREDICTED: N-acetylneuraminate lyase-like [Saccoglossus kowalevskii]
MNNQEVNGKMELHIKGLIAAPYAPFKEDGSLNLPIIDLYVDHLVDEGVFSVFVNGSTGEGVSMNVEERKKVAEKWVEAGRNKLTAVIVHVGAHSIQDVKELARHAATIGATAIAAMPTTFFKPSTEVRVASYLAEIASSAPTLPLYYYHINALTGVNISVERLFEVIDNEVNVPTFRGVKFTSPDLLDYGRCIAYGKYDVMYGLDEQLLPALSLGAETFVGSTYNYAGKLYNGIIEDYNNGDMVAARQGQFKSHAFIKVLLKHTRTGVDFCSITKALMVLCGVDVGPARTPMNNMSKGQILQLKHDLQEVGFFEWK